MPNDEPQQILTIIWLLTSGGLKLLALGLILAGIGLVLLIRPHRLASTILAFLTFLPVVVGAITVYSAASDYAEMAASPTTPKPSEFAELTGRAMSSSFCALLGTALAVFFAVLVLLARASATVFRAWQHKAIRQQCEA